MAYWRWERRPSVLGRYIYAYVSDIAVDFNGAVIGPQSRLWTTLSRQMLNALYYGRCWGGSIRTF